jgi:hypothetical protein
MPLVENPRYPNAWYFFSNEFYKVLCKPKGIKRLEAMN